jgi:hypothetical protein
MQRRQRRGGRKSGHLVAGAFVILFFFAGLGDWKFFEWSLGGTGGDFAGGLEA